jgi:Gamma-glutamyl cyclotransferase, AIG2-like
MKTRRLSVFFYGLFMDPDLLRGKGLQPENARRACVRGMRLRIGERAALELDPDGVVYGMLFELTQGDIERLYAAPSVAPYRAEAVLAEPDEGEPVAALCYNLPSVPTDQPNLEYVRKLRALATRLDLPAGYVSSIG